MKMFQMLYCWGQRIRKEGGLVVEETGHKIVKNVFNDEILVLL